jgi:hypothetical protein
VVSVIPRPLYPQGKSPRYSLDRRLGEPQNLSGQHGENSCPYRDSNSKNSVKNLNRSVMENCNDISFQILVHYKSAFYFCISHTDNLPFMSTFISSVNRCPGRDRLLKMSSLSNKLILLVVQISWTTMQDGERILS